MNSINTSRFDQAAKLAIDAHHNTERRGKGFPYIIHPMEAAAIVATITNDEELLIAAILHDVVEDTDITINQIEEQFGSRVATLVSNETAQHGDMTWRERRQVQIDKLRYASRDSKIVAIGDKLSNLRAIAGDFAQIGDNLWSRFHAPNGKQDIEWYYRGLAIALIELSDTAPYHEFIYHLNDTFGSVEESEAALINLDELEESGGGFFATSYNHKDGHVMIKFYNAEMGKEVPLQELTLAHKVYNMGLPTPMPGRLVTDGKRFGAESQRITPKKSFARYICDNPDSYREVTTDFARLCKKLHATRCDITRFVSEKEHTKESVRRSTHLTDEGKTKVLQFVDATPDSYTCLHGDMHIGNIIAHLPELPSGPMKFTEASHYWIDMGDFRWGNPLFDLGMFYMAVHCNPDELTQHLFHLSNEMMLKIWNIFIREYTGLTSDADIKEYEDSIKPYAALRFIHFGEIDKMHPYMMDFIRESFNL